jgi:hypothetical protein
MTGPWWGPRFPVVLVRIGVRIPIVLPDTLGRVARLLLVSYCACPNRGPHSYRAARHARPRDVPAPARRVHRVEAQEEAGGQGRTADGRPGRAAAVAAHRRRLPHHRPAVLVEQQPAGLGPHGAAFVFSLPGLCFQFCRSCETAACGTRTSWCGLCFQFGQASVFSLPFWWNNSLQD